MDSPLNKEGGLGGLVKAEATTTVDIHKVTRFINLESARKLCIYQSP